MAPWWLSYNEALLYVINIELLQSILWFAGSALLCCYDDGVVVPETGSRHTVTEKWEPWIYLGHTNQGGVSKHWTHVHLLYYYVLYIYSMFNNIGRIVNINQAIAFYNITCIIMVSSLYVKVLRLYFLVVIESFCFDITCYRYFENVALGININISL